MGTSPNLSQGQIPTAAQWNNFFTSKQDNLGFAPVNKAGDVMTGKLVTTASIATNAGFNIPPGVAPITPANGDIWATGFGVFSFVNGSQVLLGSNGSATFMATPPVAVSLGSVGQVTYSIINGVSVANPGTGTLEALRPIQTFNGTAYTFSTIDLFKETRRSNSGAGMTDTFPNGTATGMVNGASIIVENFDGTATITITAGTGTTIAGASTDTVRAGHSVFYIYDALNTVWRKALNTGNTLIASAGVSGRLLVDQGSGADPKFVVVSGDVTINGSGVTLIGSGAVTNAKLSFMNGNSFAASAGAATITIPNSTGTILSTAGIANNVGSISNPAGTTNGTGVMMGLGGTFTLTPRFSTRAFIDFLGQLANSVANGGCNCVVRFGTGAAPANGAALTGTALNNQFITNNSNTAGVPFPVTIPSIATGLTPGVTYWVDVSLAATSSGTVTIVNPNMVVFEV